MSVTLMAKALDALGYEVRSIDLERRTLRLAKDGLTGSWVNGVLTMNGARAIDANAINREYSKQAILKTAKAQQWQLRFQQDGTIEATKKSFA